MENAVSNLLQKQMMFGYGEEDVTNTIAPMAVNGQEPTASMGNDTPLAVLSSQPQVFFNYFRQQFAQVTNPAIDSIREELVMSLTEYIGRVGSGILTPDETNCKMVRGLHEALDALCHQAEKSVDEGYNYIILSDKDVDESHVAIPSLLAVSAVHHYLISVGKRVQTALIVESGEIRETMHALTTW